MTGSRTPVFDGASPELRRELETRNWAGTPIGPVSSWSPVLRTLVQTILRSEFPTVISWGPDLVALYNDAQIPFQSTPRTLGRSPQEIWPETWERTGNRLRQVMEKGRTLRIEDERQILDRHGYPIECHFTVSHSPIIDADGSIGGVLSVATETTTKILSERSMRALGEHSEPRLIRMRSCAGQGRRTARCPPGRSRSLPGLEIRSPTSSLSASWGSCCPIRPWCCRCR